MENNPTHYSVFLVDDDVMYLSFLKYKLREKFKSLVNISVFHKGEDCLKHLHEKPDLIILDYSLEEGQGKVMNGVEVLKKIKSNAAHTPVVMLSGQKHLEVVAESIKFGAIEYIPKSDTAVRRLQAVMKQLFCTMDQNQEMGRYERWNLLAAVSLLVLIGIDLFCYFAR